LALFDPNQRYDVDFQLTCDPSIRGLTMKIVSRRKFAIGMALMPFLSNAGYAQAALPKIIVSKDPSCSCCGSWVNYLRRNGFIAEIIETPNMERIKAGLGVPEALWSCHTAEIGGFVIKGHVPADIIRRLLAERPQVTGIAVAGMPSSAPGMDVSGATDIYDVTLFGASEQVRYARFRGLHELSN
jgi:hypothetical protein